jgi:hypothetical protein
MRIAFISIALFAILPRTSSAEITGVAGGMGAPPPTLGPYEMTPFPLDERPLFDFVTTVPSPLGGQVTFSIPMYHQRVGAGWGEWSHGYSGDVYYTFRGPSEVTLDLPADTRAFYLYAAPVTTSPQTIIATTDDGTSITEEVAGFNHAEYFGFYSDDSDQVIETITVAAGVHFVIGEFGIAIPEPGTLALLGTAGLYLLRRRRSG